VNANGQEGRTAPDGSEVVEHLRAAAIEVVAAGRALLDMFEQAMGDLLGRAGPQGRQDKPRVERIDVEDQRPPESG
jgi:hypothetical protein